MSERIHYWSIVKGIAILAVIAIHIPLTNETNSIIASRQIINFPVAMFMFVSGYFVKEETNVLNSVKRLLWPYLIWSGVWCIITPPPQSAITLISKWLFGGFSILYYLNVLIQLKLLTPWLLKHVRRNDYSVKKDALWLVTPIYLTLFSLVRLFTEDEYDKICAIVSLDCFFPAWLIYYYLGMVCKFKQVKILPIGCFIALLASYYMGVVVAFWLKDMSNIQSFPYTQSKLTSMFIAISIITLVYSIRDMGIKRNVLAKLGERSFGVYLLHMPVLIITQKVVSVVQIPLLDYVYSIGFVKYLVVLTLTISIVYLLTNILPIRVVRIWGLQ